MRLLISDAKVIDSKGKEVVKPAFLYGDAIVNDDFIMVVEECHWLREVDGCMMFLPSMVRHYFIFELSI